MSDSELIALNYFCEINIISFITEFHFLNALSTNEISIFSLTEGFFFSKILKADCRP
jgi:hypothetical protein